MSDPTPVAGHTGNGQRTPAELRARADELLARIETEGLVSGWVWGPLTETMAHLSALSDELAWVKVAYLSSVIVRGDAMFRDDHRQQQLAGMEATTRPPVPCRCGTDVPAPIPQRRGGRDITNVRCPDCGLDLVVFDGVLYDRPTLVARGMH